MKPPDQTTKLDHPVFSKLGAAEKNNIIKLASRKNYHAGDTLVRAGDIWPYLFLVETGRLCAVKESREGRSLVVAELASGELFWGLAFFQEEIPNPVTMQFNHSSTILLWHREAILPFLLKNGNMIWEISRLMVARMLLASEVIEGLAFQPVAGRLARLLIDYPGGGSQGPTIRSLTLDDMAARIGSTREMVCRFLQRFADDGMINITRTEFEILDRNRLKGIALKVKP